MHDAHTNVRPTAPTPDGDPLAAQTAASVPASLPDPLPAADSVRMPTEAPSCPNCQTPYPPVRPHFCGHCGQETALRIPTVADFIREFGGHYLSSDGALWRTLRLLMVPAALTREYMAGRRRHYLLPLRLFLSLLVASLFIGHLTESPGESVASYGPVTEGKTYLVRSFGLEIGQKDGRFICEGLPDARCAALRERWERDPQVLVELRQRQLDFMDRQTSWLLLATMPLMALLMAGIYSSRRQPFGFHMVCSLHLSSAWLVLSTLHQLAHRTWLSESLGQALLLIGALLGGVTLQRLHGGRWWVTVLRSLTLYLGCAVVFALVVSAGLWWATKASFG